MPRLLITTLSHSPLGGADRIVGDLCRNLPKRGWNTILGLTQGAVFHNPREYQQVHTDLPTIAIDGSFGTRASRVDAITAAVRSTCPDIVLSMRVFDAYEAVARLKTADIRSAPRLAAGIRSFESPYISDVRRCVHNIDACVTSGHLIAEACRRIGGMEPARVRSIAGGVHAVPEITPRHAPLRPVRLLYAGRLEQKQKRALDLIEFCRLLAARDILFELDICGTGPEEMTLARELEPHIRAGHVRLHGWVSQAELYSRFYPGADVFVHFAAWEGVTIAPREAMAHGVIPVISEFTGLYAEKQFLNGVNSLTFPVGRVDMAVERIAGLIADPEMVAQMSAAAGRSQTGDYSFEGAMDAWRDTLDACLQREPQSGPFPQVPECLDGRLTRLRVPVSLQVLARRLLNRPVRHTDPGSEWPTASRLMTPAEHEEIAAFGNAFEREQRTAACVPDEQGAVPAASR